MKNLFKYTELISGSGSCTKDITEYDINGLKELGHKDFTPSSTLAEHSATYEEYNIRFDLAGLDEDLRLDIKTYQNLRDLYLKYFHYLEH